MTWQNNVKTLLRRWSHILLQCCLGIFCKNIISPYSMIINSSQNSKVFDSINVNEISGQNKRKLIINSNDSIKLKLKIKGKNNFIKKGS